MNPIFLFIIQFIWFLIAWATIAKLLLNPVIERYELNDRLSYWLAPQLFRVLGVGLLVQNLSPQLPYSFALPTAIGDSLTAVLALISLIALQQRWSSAKYWVLVCNTIGSIDLAIALPHAAAIKAAIYLTGQWYVPAAIVPLMIVSHTMIWRILYSQRK